MEIFQEFSFDSAHHFPGRPVGHKYHGLHGHSFTARVVIAGTPDPQTGFLVDLESVEKACQGVRDGMDHRYLNEIDGLAIPSLENIAVWIWNKLKPAFPALSRVEVRRDSNRHGCVYQGG